MRNRKHNIFAITAAASLAAGFAAAPVMAQEQGYGTGQEQAAPRAEVTSAKLDQFVVALERVHEIGTKASAEMEESRNMEEAQQIQQRSQGEMIEAVEDSGLTVDEYNRIAQLMNSDPEVQERINSRLEDRS